MKVIHRRRLKWDSRRTFYVSKINRYMLSIKSKLVASMQYSEDEYKVIMAFIPDIVPVTKDVAEIAVVDLKYISVRSRDLIGFFGGQDPHYLRND